MFRCPHCGQGKEIHYRGTRNEKITVIMEDTMQKVDSVIYKDNTCLPEQAEKFVKMMTNINKGTQDVQCTKCKETNPLDKWVEAYTDPLKYFEMESLCHCGGELWMDKIPGTSSYGFVCEDCGWVKPKAIVSGS